MASNLSQNKREGAAPKKDNNLIRMEELFKIGSAEHSVPVICYVSTIHDLTKQITQVFPWNFGVGLQIVEENIDTDSEVSCVTNSKYK